MPRIRCHYIDCVFLDDDYCSAVSIEFDPDMGCMSYSRSSGLNEDEWESEEEELEGWDGMEIEDDDFWLEEDNF